MQEKMIIKNYSRMPYLGIRYNCHPEWLTKDPENWCNKQRDSSLAVQNDRETRDAEINSRMIKILFRNTTLF